MEERIKHLCYNDQIDEVLAILERKVMSAFSTVDASDKRKLKRVNSVYQNLEAAREAWESHKIALHLEHLTKDQVSEIMYNTVIEFLELVIQVDGNQLFTKGDFEQVGKKGLGNDTIDKGELDVDELKQSLKEEQQELNKPLSAKSNKSIATGKELSTLPADQGLKQTDQHLDESGKPVVRPTGILILWVVTLLGTFLDLVVIIRMMILSADKDLEGSALSWLMFLVQIGMNLVILNGLWNMKKYAVWTKAVQFLLNVISSVVVLFTFDSLMQGNNMGIVPTEEMISTARTVMLVGFGLYILYHTVFFMVISKHFKKMT